MTTSQFNSRFISLSDAVATIGGSDAWGQIKQAIDDDKLSARGLADGVTVSITRAFLPFLAFDRPEGDVLWFDQKPSLGRREKKRQAQGDDAAATVFVPPQRVERIMLDGEQAAAIWPDAFMCLTALSLPLPDAWRLVAPPDAIDRYDLLNDQQRAVVQERRRRGRSFYAANPDTTADIDERLLASIGKQPSECSGQLQAEIEEATTDYDIQVLNAIKYGSIAVWGKNADKSAPQSYERIPPDLLKKIERVSIQTAEFVIDGKCIFIELKASLRSEARRIRSNIIGTSKKIRDILTFDEIADELSRKHNKVISDQDEKVKTLALLFECASGGDFKGDLRHLDAAVPCQKVSEILVDGVEIKDLPGFPWSIGGFCLSKAAVSVWLAERGIPWPEPWGAQPVSAKVEASPSAKAPEAKQIPDKPVNRGGAPGRSDWEKFDQAIVRMAALDGINGSRTKFRGIMKDWAAGNMDPVPDDRTIEKRIDKLVPTDLWIE